MLDALCLRCFAKASVYSMLTIGTVSINEICFCNFFVIFSLIFIFSKEKTPSFFVLGVLSFFNLQYISSVCVRFHLHRTVLRFE